MEREGEAHTHAGGSAREGAGTWADLSRRRASREETKRTMGGDVKMRKAGTHTNTHTWRAEGRKKGKGSNRNTKVGEDEAQKRTTSTRPTRVRRAIAAVENGEAKR